MNRTLFHEFLFLIFLLIITGACEKTFISITDNNGDNDNTPTFEENSDYEWNENSVIDIVLKGTSITCNSEAVTITGGVVKVKSVGNYRITGSLTDGQIIVDTKRCRLFKAYS